MTVDQAFIVAPPENSGVPLDPPSVPKALALIERRDYMSLAELGREIPGLDAEKDDGGYIIGVGDAVWVAYDKVRLGSLCRAHRASCRYPAHTYLEWERLALIAAR
jgi:hypothetical protein